MSDQFDPYRKWLGIPSDEQPPHHYRLLGIGLFEDDPDVIEAAADRQMSHVQTYKTGRHSPVSQQILNELATAKLCLLNAAKKAVYDDSLRARLFVRQAAIPQAVPFAPLAIPRTPVSVAPPANDSFPQLAAYNPSAPASLQLASTAGYSVYKKQRQQGQRWELILGLAAFLAVAALAICWWAFVGRRQPSASPIKAVDRKNETFQPPPADLQVESPAAAPEVARRPVVDGGSKFFPPEDPSPADDQAPRRGALMEVDRLAAHDGPVLSLDLSRASFLLLSGGQDGTARVWNAQTRKELHVMKGHVGPVRTARISPDGKFGLTAGDDKQLRYWNLQSGQLANTVPIPTPHVRAVAFTPSGRYAYVGGRDKQLIRYDLATGKEAGREVALPGNVTDLGMYPDGTILAVTTDDGTLRVIRFPADDEDKMHMTEYKDFKHPDGVKGRSTCLAFSSDGHFLLLGNVDKAAHLFDLTTGGEAALLAGHEDTINCVAFSQDNRFALTASGVAAPLAKRKDAKPPAHDYSVRVWELATHREVARFTGHTGAVRAAVLFSGAKHGFSCGDDGLIRLWRQEPKAGEAKGQPGE